MFPGNVSNAACRPWILKIRIRFNYSCLIIQDARNNSIVLFLDNGIHQLEKAGLIVRALIVFVSTYSNESSSHCSVPMPFLGLSQTCCRCNSKAYSYMNPNIYTRVNDYMVHEDSCACACAWHKVREHYRAKYVISGPHRPHTVFRL